MQADSLLIIGIAVIAYAAVARRLDPTPISGPMVFVGLGMLLGSDGLGWLEADLSNATITGLVEATLAVVLFADASRVDLANLRRHWSLPGRLLLIGLPLAIAFGALAGVLLLPEGAWQAALLVGIMLAPTDAALGQAVVTDRAVPIWVRQGLNVESGLNDGMAFPLFHAGIAIAIVGFSTSDATGVARILFEELAFGLIAGVLVGALAGPLLSRARAVGWTGRHWHGLATLGITAAAYGLAVTIGGNPFIAAFAAGLAYRPSVDLPLADDVSHDFAELLTMLAFIVFGAIVLVPNLSAFDWRIALYALLSLTVVRGLAVVIALLGSRSRWRTVGFIAWFGPRGIASVLYSFLLLEEADRIPFAGEVVDVVMFTVAFSVLAHGMSASFLARRYGRWYSSMEDDHHEMVESAEAHEHPLGRCADPAGKASSGAASTRTASSAKAAEPPPGPPHP